MLDQDLKLEFLRESNAIEGVYDEQSLQDSVLAWGFLNKQAMSGINPFIVMQVHEILMKNVGAWSEPKLLPKYRGVFRDCPVYIGGREGMKAEVLNYHIADWCVEMNKYPNRSRMPSAEKEQRSKDLHIHYERIHPFIDGNGRTGRMFMNWWRLRNNLSLMVIHEGKEQMEYYKWFN